jgi:hypothetical protein
MITQTWNSLHFGNFLPTFNLPATRPGNPLKSDRCREAILPILAAGSIFFLNQIPKSPRFAILLPRAMDDPKQPG